MLPATCCLMLTTHFKRGFSAKPASHCLPMRFFLLACLLLTMIFTSDHAAPAPLPGPYAAQWKKIDALLRKDQTATAAPLVQALYQQAKKEGRSPDYVRALLYKICLLQANEETKLKNPSPCSKPRRKPPPSRPGPSCTRCWPNCVPITSTKTATASTAHGRRGAYHRRGENGRRRHRPRHLERGPAGRGHRAALLSVGGGRAAEAAENHSGRPRRPDRGWRCRRPRPAPHALRPAGPARHRGSEKPGAVRDAARAAVPTHRAQAVWYGQGVCHPAPAGPGR